MALSEEQRQSRSNRLGSSDAPRIMAGRWLELWREKTGRALPDDLDFVPAVQIGIVTEPLHARFYTRRTGIACFPAGERTHVHREHDFLVAHLDFLTWLDPAADPTAPADTVLEAKFTSGFKSDEELAEQYYWQVQHQMMVAALPHAVLSILRPSGYSIIHVPRSEADIATLLETLRAFWWHVENDVEPTDPLAVEPPDFEELRVVDMSLHNEFAYFGGILADNRSSLLAFREAESGLKALMPADARVAFMPGDGADGGVLLTRSRDGKLALRFGNLPRKYQSKAEPWMPGAGIKAAE